MKCKNILLVLLGFLLLSHAQAQPVYNYYFGNLHSQSSYSDGNKDSASSLMTTPLQDFNYARASQHIDFYGICDHNHFNAGMLSPVYYHKGIADADTANQDGSFVALYGMEWGIISGGGHVIVYGSDSLMGWDPGDYDIYVSQHDYTNLWRKINATPGAFAYLAHPQTGDYNDLFTTAWSPEADSAISGMAARSGPAFSVNTSYSDPASGTYLTRFQDALKRGYHVGIGLDHDAHNSNFGRQSAGRLVVLATSLTKINVMDALKRMRFYSSDDWNAKVSFSIASLPMGSITRHAGNPTLSVSVTDPDGEGVSSIKVYYGIPGSGTASTVLTSNTGASALTYTPAIPNNSTYYYYIQITQTDGNMIWTSPIWYTRDDAAGSIPSASFIAASAGCAGQPVSLIDYSGNAPTGWSWSLPGGTPSSSTLQNPVVTYSTAGPHSISLTASNASGTSTATTSTIVINPIPVVTASSVTICSGQNAVISATGASAYAWSNWQSGASITVHPVATTSYTVTGNSSGCSATAVSMVTVNTSPPSPTITLSGDTLTSSSAANNQWYLNGNPVIGATGQVYIASATGSYSVIVTSSNGCSAVSPSVNYSVIGIESLEKSDRIHLYPNPACDFVTVDFEGFRGDLSITVFNSLGELMYTENVKGCSRDCLRRIDVSSFEKGIYVFRIDTEQKVFVKKMALIK